MALGAAAIVSVLTALAGAAAAIFKFLSAWRERRAGRESAALEAARRETMRAGERGRIDAEVRRLGDAAVLDELRRNHTRD
jgi:hypothetical protein